MNANLDYRRFSSKKKDSSWGKYPLHNPLVLSERWKTFSHTGLQDSHLPALSAHLSPLIYLLSTFHDPCGHISPLFSWWGLARVVTFRVWFGSPWPKVQLSKPFFHVPWGQRSLIPSSQESHMDEDIFPEWTALWWDQVSGDSLDKRSHVAEVPFSSSPGLWKSPRSSSRRRSGRGRGFEEEEGTGFLGLALLAYHLGPLYFSSALIWIFLIKALKWGHYS